MIAKKNERDPCVAAAYIRSAFGSDARTRHRLRDAWQKRKMLSQKELPCERGAISLVSLHHQREGDHSRFLRITGYILLESGPPTKRNGKDGIG